MELIKRILVATDFSEDSEHCLEYAKEIARRFGTQIVLLHVDEAMAVVPGSEMAEKRRAAAMAELDRIVTELRSKDLSAVGILRPGSPPTEIVKMANDKLADLIVMGTHGRTGLAHILIGSVAEQVVRRAPCPVLVIRHPGRRGERANREHQAPAA